MSENQNNKTTFISKFFIPLLFGLFKLIGKLPYPVVRSMGRTLGRILYKVRNRRLIVEANLRYSFNNKSFDERQEIARKHFLALGEGLMEVTYAWYKPLNKENKYYALKGLEHYEKAKESGKGVLFLAYHTTSIELAIAIMAQYIDFAIFYRPNDDPAVDDQINAGRKNHFTLISKTNTHSTIRWLKSTRDLFITPDQDMSHHQTVFAPFFGNPACTLTSPQRIAKLGKAKVLPVSYHKDEKGVMKVEVLPEIEFTGDDYIDCTMTNKILEACIMQAPEQYYWVHRRFKTLPEGQRSIYYQKPPKLKYIDSKQHDGALYSGKILSRNDGMPKLVRTVDGQLLNVFFRGTSLGIDLTRKELRTMLDKCAMLTFRGFYTISPKEFTFCSERNAYMIRYQEAPGVALHHIPQSRRHPTAIVLGNWLAQLHNEGIRLGNIREANIQLLPNGSPILLNPRNCEFYNKEVKETLREKDIVGFINAISFIEQDQTSQQLFREQYQLNRLNEVENSAN